MDGQRSGAYPELEAALRAAGEAGEVRLGYQPIVNVSDGRLLGFEALLRWQHPERGEVLPRYVLGALDCPGAFAFIAEGKRAGLLGRRHRVRLDGVGR